MRRALAKQPPRVASFNENDIEDKKWKRKSYALAQYNGSVHMDPIPANITYFPPPTTTPQPTPGSVHHPFGYVNAATTPLGSQTHLATSSRQGSLSVIYPTPPPSATPSLRASQDLVSVTSVPTLSSSLTSLNSDNDALRSSISESPDPPIANGISPHNHITHTKQHDTGQDLKRENGLQRTSLPEVSLQQPNEKQILPQLQNIKSQSDRRASLDFITRLRTTGLIPYLEVPPNSGDSPGLSSESKDDLVTETFWTRFYILTIASLIFFMQCIIWGTFGPISASVRAVYPSWTDQTLAMFILNAAIVVTIFTMPMMWLSQKFGLRFTMIMCAATATMSATLRCLTKEETPFTVMCYICSVTNAFSTCFALALPPTIAATWFPPKERTTATAIGALATQLGGAGMYFAPLLVHEPEDPQSRPDIEATQDQIMNLMYIYAGILWFLLITVVVYFPSRPLLPPSLSSTVESLNFVEGFKTMIKNRQVGLTMLTYCFSFGIPVVWVGVLNISLEDMNFKQDKINKDEIMLVGICSVSVSGIAAFLTAVISDRLYGHLRITVICLLAASSACFLWFLLLILNVIHPTLGQVAAAVTGGVSFQFASVPLLMEMTVEMVYPCSENVVGAVLTTSFNVISTTFLLMFQIPVESYVWVSGVLLASQTLTIIPLLLVRETYNRTSQDTKNKENNAKEVE